jgi:hypothetical protein
MNLTNKSQWQAYIKLMVNRFTLMFTVLFTAKYIGSYIDPSLVLDIPDIYKTTLIFWVLIPVYEYFFQRRNSPHIDVPS